MSNVLDSIQGSSSVRRPSCPPGSRPNGKHLLQWLCKSTGLVNLRHYSEYLGPNPYSRRQYLLTSSALGATVRECLEFFEKDGFRFFFYSNEHEPIHVHVQYADGEAVFVVGATVELRESQGIKLNDLARAEKLAEENKDLIVKTWNEHFKHARR